MTMSNTFGYFESPEKAIKHICFEFEKKKCSGVSLYCYRAVEKRLNWFTGLIIIRLFSVCVFAFCAFLDYDSAVY